eukprot:gene6949-14109_t
MASKFVRRPPYLKIHSWNCTSLLDDDSGVVKGMLRSYLVELPNTQTLPLPKIMIGEEKDDDGAAKSSGKWTALTAPSDKKYKWKFYFSDLIPSIREQIQMDEVGTYSVTDMKSADLTSKLIIEKLDITLEEALRCVIILDGCACIGGNTISFGKYFADVTAIELSTARYEMLKHNLSIIGLDSKVKAIKGNFCEMIPSLQYYDVIFLDPPWGGTSYRAAEKVDIFMSEIPLIDICRQLIGKLNLLVLKLPENFNLISFRNSINKFAQIILETSRIRKTLILVVKYPTTHILRTSRPTTTTTPATNTTATSTSLASSIVISQSNSTISKHKINELSSPNIDNRNNNDSNDDNTFENNIISNITTTLPSSQIEKIEQINHLETSSLTSTSISPTLTSISNFTESDLPSTWILKESSKYPGQKYFYNIENNESYWQDTEKPFGWIKVLNKNIDDNGNGNEVRICWKIRSRSVTELCTVTLVTVLMSLNRHMRCVKVARAPFFGDAIDPTRSVVEVIFRPPSLHQPFTGEM